MAEYGVGDTIKISRVGVLVAGPAESMYLTSTDGKAPVNVRSWDVEVIEKAKPTKPKVGDVYSLWQFIPSQLPMGTVIADRDGWPEVKAVGSLLQFPRSAHCPYTLVYLPPED